MSISKKKLTAFGAAGIAALTLACASTYVLKPSEDLSAYASVEEVEDRVKVFVGDINSAPESYVQQRATYIADTADTKANMKMGAVIGLDDYYTADEITAWAEKYDVIINRAYMWPKGETGRLSLYVENGNLESSIETYKQEVEENHFCDDPQFAKDYQRFLDGEYEVFALTVTASAETLEALSTEADCISYVDVMYNPEVEKYAKKAKKAVSYIELPAKPDGAL